MAENLTDSFDVLLDQEEWMQAGAVFSGYLAPTVARNVIEPNAPFNVPDELYGVGVMVAGQYSPMYETEISLGGGVYAVDKLAERVDLQDRVAAVGGN